MIQFAADFESSKEIVYKTPKVKSKALPAHRVVEEEIVENGVKKKVKSLKNCDWYDRTVDRQKSKTWVYLWGIETLDMEFYKVGYCALSALFGSPKSIRLAAPGQKVNVKIGDLLYETLQHTYKTGRGVCA